MWPLSCIFFLCFPVSLLQCFLSLFKGGGVEVPTSGGHRRGTSPPLHAHPWPLGMGVWWGGHGVALVEYRLTSRLWCSKGPSHDSSRSVARSKDCVTVKTNLYATVTRSVSVCVGGDHGVGLLDFPLYLVSDFGIAPTISPSATRSGRFVGLRE